MSGTPLDETGRAEEKGPEHSDSLQVDRRTFMKATAAAGTLSIITSRKSAATGLPPPAEPVLCPAPAPVSPPTTPFVDALPIPTPAVPVLLSPFPTKHANIAGGEAARAEHQAWDQFHPAVYYRMTAAPSLHTHHSDLLPSYMWTFNQSYPAPTILAYYGAPALVRFRNDLPETHNTFGRNEISIHMHNGHTPSESDGFAGDFFGTGFFKDNHYPNVYAGVDDFGGIGDPREAMHTSWFHDHREAFTAQSNYLGLNGMYILYDQNDPGHELPTPGNLRLPSYYGVTDIPLILTDKRFCAAANGRNEVFQVIGGNAPGGDKWIVNGKIQPRLTVRRRKYRFRILNTGPVKQWNLSFIGPDGSQAPMTVVAVDANFLEGPFDIASGPLNIQVANRFDVIVDFSAFPHGSSVYLRENAAQNVGVSVPDPAPGLAIQNVLMRFDVINREPWFPADTPPVPSVLAAMPDPMVPDDFFEWRFTLEGGRFLINGLEFDRNRIDHVVLKGSTEEWVLANDVAAGNWNHPVHIHFEQGRMVSRRVRVSQNPDVFESVPLQPEELGRRDTYRLPPQNRIVLRMRFRDFVGRYLIHCHNMNHEDDFMMMRWDIVNSVSELITRRREIDERRLMAGLPPQYGQHRGGLA
jgi:FtsP/CotA-like multicopper oxidase with cupredoxin domain